jgi:hypothetical protein
LKLAFEDFYAQPAELAEPYLAGWVEMTLGSGLEPMIDVACRVAEHWDGVLRWFTSKVSNGLLEAISSLVQAAKRRARGYRTTRNLKAIVYLAAGKLDFRPATCFLTFAEFGVACGLGAGFKGKAPREGARWLSRLRLPRGVRLPRRWRPPVGTIQAFDPSPLHRLFISWSTWRRGQ